MSAGADGVKQQCLEAAALALMGRVEAREGGTTSTGDAFVCIYFFLDLCVS